MKKPLRYVARPLEVHALQWTGENIEAVEDFAGTARCAAHDPVRQRLYLFTVDGAQSVYAGSWLVIDHHRNLFILTDSWFREQYAETVMHHPV